MITAEYDLVTRDIDKIKSIPIVPVMLEVICRATGMGFAAIARVTEDRWIACSVRDEINFGLQAGGELKLETTICNEIRQSRQAVIIDEVSSDSKFCNHHTPKMYGFQSYISLPIILNSGEFFGTLCAIDPKPAHVSDLKIVGMFTLFAQLIAFHLQAMDTLDMSRAGLQNANAKLVKAEQENLKLEYLTYVTLKQPLRKISLLSEMLIRDSDTANISQIRESASAINKASLELVTILQNADLSR